MHRFRGLFPITEEYVYLNSAAACPLANPVKQAMEKCIGDQYGHGNRRWDGGWSEKEEEVRQKLAALTGVSPAEIALMGNTVQGLSTVASGLDWKPGDNVVTDSLENPANIYPWLNLQRRYGVELRIVPARDGRVIPDDLFSAVDGKTRVVTVSSVQWTNGFRVDLESIGGSCRERGIYLVVDAIQHLGALPFDARALNVDFLSAGAYKSLLGPVGVGCFFCRQELLDELWPAGAGHRSVVDATTLDYRMELRPTAQRFEGGALNYVGLHGFNASLDLIREAGVDSIEQHLLRLTDLLVHGLREKGYLVLSSLRPEERSGIVSFGHGEQDAAQLVQRLMRSGIIVSLRNGAVRVSTHLYNDEEDIERLVVTLP